MVIKIIAHIEYNVQNIKTCLKARNPRLLIAVFDYQ
jgi:hypothetical protein